jgi:hypothetical protein
MAIGIPLTWIKGQNACGKTETIRKMLKYNVQEHLKTSFDDLVYTTSENDEYLVLETVVEWQGCKTFVRYFLGKNCASCKAISKLWKRILEQESKIIEKKERLEIASEIKQDIDLLLLEKQPVIDQVKELKKRKQQISKKHGIDFDDLSFKPWEIDESTLSSIQYPEITKIEIELKQKSIIVSDFNRKEEKLMKELRSRGGDNRGFKKLVQSLEYNIYSFYKKLSEHSYNHDIDVWISGVRKIESLMEVLGKIDAFKIRNLFIDKVDKSFLKGEIQGKFDRFLSFVPRKVKVFSFPTNVGHIYVETNSNDENVVIEESNVLDVENW